MTSFKPPGYHSLAPHVTVGDARGAIAFYEKALGAELTCCVPGPGGAVMHAELRIGDSPLMLNSEFGDRCRSPQTLGGTPVRLSLYVEDCDAVHHRAVEAGATSLAPPADQFWGDRYAMVRDPFGHEWEIMTHLEDLTPEQLEKRAAEFFANWDPSECDGGGG